ncbi:hypothetical protein [Granulicella sp. S190]|uniref:hypothetical protein n=1 Tax=Granulicella sp. S190 TaxID=1747226 RepID=UPI00131D8473|nr:hypothetical protein [Granulicella sp. S190]
MDTTTEQLFFAIRNFYDVVTEQQKQLDVVAESHFKLADTLRNALGMEPESRSPSSASHAAILKAKIDIDELEQLFKKGKS